jgi:hypothetical protein
MHLKDSFRAFSSQVESLGGSENATKQMSRAFPVNQSERETLSQKIRV